LHYSIIARLKANMELRHLRYFQKIAELSSFSEASRALNITQSTLSQQTKKLEDELGVTLFQRDSHHVQLTDIGEAILPAVEKILSDANTCINIIHDVRDLGIGSLTIGATQSFTPLLRETVIDFTKQFPGIKLNIVCKQMEELMSMLDKREIDIALCYRPSMPMYDSICTQKLFVSSLCVVVADTHPLASRKEIDINDLQKLSLVLPEKGTQARNTFDMIISGMNLDLNVHIEMTEINMLLDIVQGTRFATLVSQITTINRTGLKAIPLKMEGVSMEGSIHYRRDTYMKKATKQFLEMLSDHNSYGLALLSL